MGIKHRFGERLRQLRLAAELTQLDVAEACDVSVETISNIERGKHGPRLELIEALAKAVNTQLPELFTFDY